MRIAVIGGGAAGLAAADELLKSGHEVLLFEQGPQLGGQLRTVSLLGTRLECLYHHLFTSDTLVAGLLEELGLGDRLQWVRSKVGFFANGRVWDFVTPLDLLRFGPLPLLDRIRLGLVGLYLQRQGDWRRFEPDTAEEWLRRWAGENAYKTVWGPLLYGKFGGVAPEVGMAWFHWKMRLRFGSRRGLDKEYLGYPVGSFAQLWEALGERIQGAGGHVYTQARVETVCLERGRVSGLRVQLGPASAGPGPGPQPRPENQGATAASAGAHSRGPGAASTERLEDGSYFFAADRVIATVPTHVLTAIAPDLPEHYLAKLAGTSYQAVICAVLVLKRPISHIYWMNISDRSIPFVAVIEQTNLIGPEHYGGKHVAYLSHYLSPDDPIYSMSDAGVLATYLPHLPKINPAFTEDWVEEAHVFRERAAQPVITRNYSQRIPPLETPIPGLYMANNTQVYPEDRGQNYSIRIGRQVARLAVS